MKYSWIDEYLMAKRGVTKDLQRNGTGSGTISVEKCLPLFSWMTAISRTILT